MKIAVFGAAGNIGRRIVREALDRRHQVNAVGRHALVRDILAPWIVSHALIVPVPTSMTCSTASSALLRLRV